jgi:P4 family phage/plasmid primase-like protien
MEYKIWSIDRYKGKEEHFIENNYIKFNRIKELICELENDKGYHFRIKKGNQYIFFGDCDKYDDTLESFRELLKVFLKDNYDLLFEDDEFKYTVNDTNPGSFHYSICKWNLSTEKLWEIHNIFLNKYQDKLTHSNGNCVDTSIYCNKWFRCPNQKKGNENYISKHIIKNGNMENFIIEYIPKDSININDVKYLIKPDDIIKPIKAKKKKSLNKINNEYDMDCNIKNNPKHIENLLKLLTIERCNDYWGWLCVGLALHNISNEYLNLWKEWSKQSSKYKINCCEEQWKGFINKADGLQLGSLHFWARIDNKDEYFEFRNTECLRKFIKEHEDDLSSIDADTLQLGKPIKDKNRCIAKINSNYCHIGKKEHKKSYNQIEVLNNYGGAITCTYNKCIGKTYKNKLYGITNDLNYELFGAGRPVIVIAKNFNQQINNYNGETIEDDIDINDGYKIFDDDELNRLVMNSLDGTPVNIAHVIWHLANNKFRCTKSKNWYVFKNHIWIIDDTEIRYYISNILTTIYKKVIKYYKELYKKETNETEKNVLKIKIKQISEIEKSLRKTGQISNILTESEHIFYRNCKEFEEKLDINPYLLGFTNGIYDFQEFIFRDGKLDDYVTMTVGYDYNPVYSEHINDLKKFLSDIQPYEDERDYILTICSLSLVGINTQELFHIFSGNGRNGKSKFAELLSLSFGDYYEPVNATLLTKEQPSADKPRPELLQLKKKRLVIASEPENRNQMLNAAFIKLLTGNDKLTARTLFNANIITFIASFNLFMLCNDIPNFDKNDDAIWERGRCNEFPNKFVVNPVGDREKLIDYGLKEKLTLWRIDFMLLLIEYYKKFKVVGKIIPPENVLRFTKQTKDNDDLYKQYLDERTVTTNNNILTVDLYNDFKLWFSNNNPKKNIPSNKEFVKSIRKYVEICDKLRIGIKVSCGIKNLQLII